jgi:hypothetical protein
MPKLATPLTDINEKLKITRYLLSAFYNAH